MSNQDSKNETIKPENTADQMEAFDQAGDASATEVDVEVQNAAAHADEVPEMVEDVQVSAPAQAPAAASPGALLKAAREKANCSVAELIGETKLTRAVLQALEDDNFDVLPKPVYVRGYYKKCAQVLNASEGAILDAYTAMVGVEKTPEPVPFTLPQMVGGDFDGAGGRRGGRMSSGLIVLILGGLVGVVAYWYMNGNSGNADDAGNSQDILEMPLDPLSESAAPAVIESEMTSLALQPEALTQSSGTLTPEEIAAVDSTEVAESDQPPAEEADNSTETSATTTVSTTTGSGDLTVKFNQACWTDIRDNNGERLLFGLIEAGETHKVGGVHPYRILLGNPQGIEMVFAGVSVNLEAHTRANKTAVFSLGG